MLKKTEKPGGGQTQWDWKIKIGLKGTGADQSEKHQYVKLSRHTESTRGEIIYMCVCVCVCVCVYL